MRRRIVLQNTSCEIHQRSFPFVKVFWSAHASSRRFWERGPPRTLDAFSSERALGGLARLLASPGEKCFQFDLTGEALALDAAVV